MKSRIIYQKFFLSLLVLFFIIFGSCYPKRVGPIGQDGKRLTWKEMNMKQRKVLMNDKVLPRADKIFRSWRPERFKEINCTLCHGQQAKIGNFKMPTNHLPRLSGDWTLKPEFEKHPDTTKLKLRRLVPMMSKAMGIKSFSVRTRSGFGCYSCHLGPKGAMFGN